MNFGWLDDKLSDKDYKQVVLHEFGHALGLIHEHQSPATKIKWNKDYVYWYFREFHKWDSGTVDTNIFKEFEKTTIRHSTLDKASIMGYHILQNSHWMDKDFRLIMFYLNWTRNILANFILN